MIFETHAHYDDERFDPDRAELLSSMKEKNIGHIINIGASMAESEESIRLSKEYQFIYASVGAHPDEIGILNDEWMEKMYFWCSDPKVVAVGEIGLDYYFDDDVKDKEAIKEKQIFWFKKQLEVAEKAHLPVIIHSRDAAEDTMNILTTYAAKVCPVTEENAVEMAEGIVSPGVIHCYSYSLEQAKIYLKQGWYFGIGGVLTFKKSKKLQEVVEYLPLSRILTETDSPYLCPEPFRGSRNDSTYIPYVIQKIAEIKGISEVEVTEQTERNAMRLFKKVPEYELKLRAGVNK